MRFYKAKIILLSSFLLVGLMNLPSSHAEVFDPNSFPPVTAPANIESSNYPLVAALARSSIFEDQPVAPTTQKITYQFESGVPIENQKMIREGADNFLSRFSNI